VPCRLSLRRHRFPTCVRLLLTPEATKKSCRDERAQRPDRPHVHGLTADLVCNGFRKTGHQLRRDAFDARVLKGGQQPRALRIARMQDARVCRSALVVPLAQHWNPPRGGCQSLHAEAAAMRRISLFLGLEVVDFAVALVARVDGFEMVAEHARWRGSRPWLGQARQVQ
jgi:hypothetical protein